MEVFIMIVDGDDSGSGIGEFIVGLICLIIYVINATDELKLIQMIAENITMYAQNPYVIVGFAIGTLIMSFIKYTPWNSYIAGYVCLVLLSIVIYVSSGTGPTVWEVILLLCALPFVAALFVSPVIDFLASLLTLPLAIVSKKHRRNLGYSCAFAGYIGIGMLGEVAYRLIGTTDRFHFISSIYSRTGINDIDFIIDKVETTNLAIMGATLVIISFIAIIKIMKKYDIE